MKGFNYTILFITIALLLGILFSPYLNLSAVSLATACAISFISLLAVHLFTFYKRINTPVFTGLAILTFIFLGALTANLQDPLNNSLHYENTKPEKNTGAVITIKEVLKPGTYAYRFYAELNALGEKSASGKILLYINKDSLTPHPELKVDATYFVATGISEITGPKNPYQFNYRNYLKRQGVYNQISANTNQLYVLNTEAKTLKGYAAVLRKNLQKSIENRLSNSKNRAVIEALLLGQRQELSTDLTEDYAAAGMIHILAVSGLHVGIIMLLFQFILNPLGNTPAVKLIRTVFIITVIWVFAFITGFSPSVLRAATMFSFIQIGVYFNRKNAGLNALVFSAFVLLLFATLVVGITGFIVVPLRRMGVMTIPEFYEKRFSRGVRVLGGLLLALAGILNMGMFLKVGGMFVTDLTGLPPNGIELKVVMTVLLALVLLLGTAERSLHDVDQLLVVERIFDELERAIF